MDDVIILIIIFFCGIFAGFINTIAGGGSLLVLPVLMFIGLPAQIANATNRLSIFFGALVGIFGFAKKGHMPKDRIMPILIPSSIGGIAGSIMASITPDRFLGPIFLSCMITVALIMLFKPNTINDDPNIKPVTYKEKPMAFLFLFGAGFYGGFIQAGVGFMLLAALCGGLKFDLLKGNAFKVLATFMFTLFSVIVFIVQDQIWYKTGLVLAAGNVIGSFSAVKFAVSVKPKILKKIIIYLVLVACVANIIKYILL